MSPRWIHVLLALTLYLPVATATPQAADSQSGSANTAAADTAQKALEKAQANLEAAKEAALAEGADATATQQAIDDATAVRDAAMEQLKTAVESLQAAGANTDDYEAALMAIDPSGNLSVGAAVALTEKWVTMAKDWAINEGPGYVIKLILFLVIFTAFKILSKIMAGIVKRALKSSKLKPSKLFEEFLINIVRKVTIFTGVVIGLQTVGVDMGPILAGVGVFGFVIGFALQDTLGNFAAGVMLLLYRPYDVGDVVTAAGVTGKVETMTLVSTTISTPDNIEITVPNGAIWGGVITNVSTRSTRRVDLTAGIGYTDDIDKAEEVLMDILEQHPKVLSEPAPMVKLNELADSSVNFVVRPWVKTADYWDVYFDVTKSIKERFDAAGLSIPYPQQDVHLVTDQPIEHRSA